MKKINLWALIIFFVFLFFGLLTLSDYGVNWDMPIHYVRGQGYLHYFLSGKRDYSDFKIKPPSRKSIYQIIDYLDTSYYLKNDSGHPPLSDILASLSNYVFYQKLNILDDLESYHFFILLVSSLLVVSVFWWNTREYGLFAGVIAALSLSLYPLFLAESHFNVKDPVETFFYFLTIYYFYLGVKNQSWFWFFLSAVVCGFAMGTKFNIFFAPVIIVLWLAVKFLKDLIRLKIKFLLKLKQIPKKIWGSLFLYPVIVFSIFFFSWPYLWSDPINRLWRILGFYKQLGISAENLPEFLIFGIFKSYPLQTLIYTTPVVILIFTIFGVTSALFAFKEEKHKTSFLFLIWMIIPILRVSFKDAGIYGGLRQIMEFAPAMALLAGLGAENCRKLVIEKLRLGSKRKTSFVVSFVIVLSFLPITKKMADIHPNQNVYFNFLIGGLKGAKEKNYPYWGDTLGSVYKQGVEWLNQNAEKNARVALVVGGGGNIPETYFRKDIKFANGFWSGSKKEGEYLIEATYQDWIREYYYAGEYVEKILQPVYEVKVDDVPILEVWKNDLEHTKKEYLNEDWLDSRSINWRKDDDFYLIELKDSVEITNIVIIYGGDDCSLMGVLDFYSSLDKENWEILREPIKEYMIDGPSISYPVAARKAKYVKIMVNPSVDCAFEIKNVKIKIPVSL